MVEVVISDVARHEMRFAAGVLARGMRDNPIHIAAFGDDPLRRMRALERIFGSLLPLMKQPPLSARRGEHIVGVTGMSPPGTCQPPPFDQLRLLPAILRIGPGALPRVLRWLRAWADRDLKDRHWHLGPLAVEGGLQGMGIGSQIMQRFCARMDEDGEVAYLETDKPENVLFYQKFGFQTIEEADVLGTPNWFMRREHGEARDG
jgi:hypothetical protein